MLDDKSASSVGDINLDDCKWLLAGILLLLLLLSVPAHASAIQWQQLNSPQTYSASHICAKSAGDIFTIVPGSGAYHSTNSGASWTLCNSNLITLAIAPNGAVYGGTAGNGVLVSLDDGQTWNSISTGLPAGAILSLIATAQGDVLAGVWATDWDVCRLPNGSSNWVVSDLKALSVRGVPNVLAVDQSGNTILAGNHSDLCRSADSGVTWTKITPPFGANGSVQAALVSSSGALLCGASTGLFRSTDNGATWSQTFNNSNGAAVISLLESNGAILAGTSYGGFGEIFSSADNGLTFNLLTTNAKMFAPVGVLAAVNCLATDGANIYAGANGVFDSADNGNTWTLELSGLSATAPQLLHVVVLKSGAIYSATSNSGIYRSFDNGNTWSAVNSGLNTLFISSLGLNAADEVLAGTFAEGPLGVGVAGDPSGHAFRLVGNGNQWSQAGAAAGPNGSAPYGNQKISNFITDSAGDVYCTAMFSGSIFRSTDGGSTYTSVFTPGGAGGFIVARDPNGNLYWGGETNVVYTSSSGGPGSWSGLPPILNNGQKYGDIWAEVFNSSGELFVSGDHGGIFQFSNGAWMVNSLNVGSDYVNSMVTNSQYTMFAATGRNGIFQSVDGGQTWQSGGLAGGFGQYAMFVDSVGYLYVCGGSNGALYRTVNSTLSGAALSITTGSPLATGDVGAAYSQTFAATGGTLPFSWSISSGTLPAGLSLSAEGVLSGTPTTLGASNFTVVVTDTAAATVTKVFALTINAAPSVTTISPLAIADIGAAYLQTFAVSGGTTPFTWSVSAGALPTGLNLSAAGVLSGTPTIAGTANFTVLVTDAINATASKAFALTINTAPSISTASPLPVGAVGAAYSQTFVVSGGSAPFTWSISAGALPVGLNLSAGGVLSGVPTTAGIANFTIKVTDAVGVAPTKAFSLTIDATLSITTGSPLSAGDVGTAYSQTLGVSGGTAPFAWSVSAGALPPGLNLSAAGALSGTPTVAAASNFTILVRDAANATATKAIALTINAAPSIPTVSPLAAGNAGTAYSQTLAVSGGTAPFAWSLSSGALPTGLNLSAAGVISGTPTTAGTFNFTIKVTDAAGAAPTKAFALTVIPTNQPPTITSAASATPNPALVAQTVVFTVSASDPDGDVLTYTWAFGDGSTGSGNTVSHVYPAANTFYATATVSDGTTTVQSTVSVTVTSGAAALTITTTSMPAGLVGTAYSQTLAANGGAPPYTWLVSRGLPPETGLNLSAAGIVSGMPAVAGTFNFTIKVTDAAGATATKAFSVTFTKPPLAMSISAFKAAVMVKGGHDNCSLEGVIPNLASTFVPGGALVNINVGGAKVNFTLDNKGHGKYQQNTLALTLKLVKSKGAKKLVFEGGNVPFKLQLKDGSWPILWAASGLDMTKTSGPIAMNVTITINGQLYATVVTAKYSGKIGRGGAIGIK